MEPIILGIGIMNCPTEQGNSPLKMAITMKANGLMDKLMGTASTINKMGPAIKVIGRMTNHMEKAWK